MAERSLSSSASSASSRRHSAHQHRPANHTALWRISGRQQRSKQNSQPARPAAARDRRARSVGPIRGATCVGRARGERTPRLAVLARLLDPSGERAASDGLFRSRDHGDEQRRAVFRALLQRSGGWPPLPWTAARDCGCGSNGDQDPVPPRNARRPAAAVARAREHAATSIRRRTIGRSSGSAARTRHRVSR